jgi:hypothetical protein
MTDRRTIGLPVAPRVPFPMPTMGAGVSVGGAYHGDGRGFSLDTSSPAVTSRVVFWAEVNLDTVTVSKSASWCDESIGPLGGFGPQGRATAIPKTKTLARRDGHGMFVKMDMRHPTRWCRVRRTLTRQANSDSS